jgi:class 3 adenylate cyclase
VIIPDERASRRHAFIHCQGEDEYWLVDQGSSNGTYVNDKRIHQPTQLHDGDRISIVGSRFIFRHPDGPARPRLAEATDQTVIQVRTQPCWLLLADIVGSSALANELPAEQLALTVGAWFASCKQAIEEQDGAINKYLGDGFFAYWRHGPGLGPRVLGVVRRMMVSQEPTLPVRYVLHFGEVTVGGAPSLGEESLSGTDVNFVFRLEKVAAGLKQPFLCSEAVVRRLPETVLKSAGRHALPGFAGDHEVFILGGATQAQADQAPEDAGGPSGGGQT